MPDVTITVEDITIPATPSPLPGSVVKLLSTTLTLLAQGTTDSNGELVFVGVDPGDYYIRAKPNMVGYSITDGATKTLSVQAGSTPEVLIQAIGPLAPQSTDPAYCRCWGYFAKINGIPAEGMTINFQRDDTPTIVVDETDRSIGVIGGGSYSLTLDDDGYGEIDLPCNVELSATIPGYQDEPTRFTVPDLRTSNLVDVLFPYPRDIKFYSGGSEITSIVLAQGATTTVDVVATARSGWVMDSLGSYFSLESSDETIAIIALSDTVLSIQALSAGTCTVTCTVDSGQFIVPVPAVDITLNIGVT